MAQYFEAVDQFFQEGIGLADQPRLEAIQTELKTDKSNLETKLAEIKEDEDKEAEIEALENELDSFDECEQKITSLFDAIKKLKDKKASTQTDALAQKQSIVDGVLELIQSEKNIKSAFEKFNEYQDQWNKLENVDLNKSKKLDKQYGKLVEDFYYHINIYKAIQDHDFKRNQQLKSNLITRLKGMLQLTQSKGMLAQLQQIQKEWQSIGPVGKEMREQIWEEYIQTSDAVFSLYLEIREKEKSEQKENLVKKQTILKTLNETLTEERKSIKDWKTSSDKIIELQNEWKEIGLIPKKDSKTINKEFRNKVNDFFKARNAFFAEQKDQYKDNKKVRFELIEKAEALAAGETNQENTNQIIQLQYKWKASGPVHPRDEQKLWKRFREACNTYFDKKNKEYNAHKSAVKQSLDEKKSVINLLDKATDLQSILEATEAFVATWPLSKGDTQKLDNKIQNILKEKILELDDAESAITKSIEVQQKALEKIEVEDFSSIQQMIRSAINALNEDVRQFETNLSFFNTSKSNPLLEQAQTSLENTKNVIEAHKAILKTIREKK